MGLKVRGAVRCGRCGKPRGIRHDCVTRFGRRTRRHKVQSPVTWECGTCGKPRSLAHTCRQRTDFKARRRKQATEARRRKRQQVRARQAARRRQAAAERRARERARKAAARRRRPRPARPQGDRHEPGTCGDRDCPKFGCQAYWQGVENCPLPHGG
jgi:hypothetical protein